MKKVFLYALFVLFLLVAADVIAAFLWFRAISENENQPLKKKVRVGLLFMGSFEKKYTKIGKDTLRRVHHVKEMYTRGTIKEILCIGGSRPQKGVFGSIMMKERLIELGVPPEKIHTETESYDSTSNWQLAMRLMADNHWKTSAVVSSPLHVRRLKKIILENPVSQFEVYFSPYSYQSFRDTDLSLSPLEIWCQVNYEWIAYLTASILPDAIYRSILKFLRYQHYITNIT